MRPVPESIEARDTASVVDVTPPAGSGPGAEASPDPDAESNANNNGSPADRTPDEGGQSRSLEQIGNFFAVAWLPILFGLIWFYNADIEPRLKAIIAISASVVIVAGVLGGIAWATRQRPAVRKAAAIVLLVGLVVLTALAPVILLGQSDRILLLKLGAIAFMALFPALLYLQFVAARAETLREEYVLNLHRLKVDAYDNLPPPPPGSIFRRDGDTRRIDEHQDNLYLQKFDAIYGVRVRHAKGASSTDQDDQEEQVVVRKGGSLLPVALCTVLLAVGWALVLQPEPIETDQVLSSVTLSGRPVLPTDALRFGFLGAYFFIIEMITRRYFQDDLKAAAYLNGATRILSSAILIAALHQLWPDTLSASQEIGFAFVIGVFPIVGLQAIQSLIAKLFNWLVPSLKKDHPLSDLDGLNVWYESRLLEEGIEDMQNLATANIVDVMLRTRVPVDRLVDWIDQAVLDLRVKDGKHDDSDRATLRRLGIRTATDLEDALRVATVPAPNGRTPDPIEPKGFQEKMQDVLNKNSATLPSITVSVWKTLAREPNLYHVRQWKETAKDLSKDKAANQPSMTSGAAAMAATDGEASPPDDAAMEELAR